LSIPQPYNERSLLQQLHRGEKEAFSFVFTEFYAALCAYAEKLTGSRDHVEDIVEEVFMKIWLRQQEFGNLNHLKNFLYKTTRNACIDHLRRLEHSRERQAQFQKMQHQFESPYDHNLIRVELYRSIYRAIEQLPEQCGRIVRMGYIEGRTNEEIASTLGLSIQTVKNQKSRGISLLKLRLPPESFALFLLIARF
jgi:RNA polymerase sigma-70 factor (ECF subfamily)